MATLPTLADLQNMLAEAKAQRHVVALGNAVVEVWRNGRRVQVEVTSIEKLQDYIMALEREIDEQTMADAGKNKRRAITLAWPN